MAKYERIWNQLSDRVSELERIVTESRRPPSRLGTAIRYLVENLDALEQMIEKHRESMGKKAAASTLTARRATKRG